MAMSEEIFAHQHIDPVHLGRIGQDGIHVRDVAEYVSTTALDMRLAPRQVGERLRRCQSLSVKTARRTMGPCRGWFILNATRMSRSICTPE